MITGSNGCSTVSVVWLCGPVSPVHMINRHLASATLDPSCSSLYGDAEYRFCGMDSPVTAGDSGPPDRVGSEHATRRLTLRFASGGKQCLYLSCTTERAPSPPTEGPAPPGAREAGRGTPDNSTAVARPLPPGRVMAREQGRRFYRRGAQHRDGSLGALLSGRHGSLT